MSTVSLTGLDDILSLLDRLGKQGDDIAREAATKAATLLRQTYIVQAFSGETGLKRSTIMRYTYIKKATDKYPHARINFSGAGIPVTEFRYRYQRKGAQATRAKIIVDFVGGEKVAAGFINPLGKNKTPLSSASQRTTKNGKTYKYRNTKPEAALAPSLATAYQRLDAGQVEKESLTVLSDEIVALLDDLLGDK